MSVDLLEQEREWYIHAPWGRICIVAWGNCLDTPVLVVHGERDSLASFRPLMKFLPTNFYYVGLELPGQGKSSPFPRGLPVTLWDLVYAIEVVRQHFRYSEFFYMAHSLAAILGRLYDLTHPNRLLGAIELDQITPNLAWPLEKITTWFDRGYVSHFEKFSQYNSPKENAPKYTWEQAIEKVLKVRDLPPEAARATVERFSEPAGKGLIRFTYDRRSKHFLRPFFTPEQIEEMYTKSPTPTLGIIAEESVAQGLFDKTPFLLKNRDTYRVRKVCGNHDVHIKHPDRVALFICQFLKNGIAGLDRKAKL